MGRNSFAKRNISYLLLFLDCRQVLVPAIATAGFMKYLFESSNRAKLRAGTGRPARFYKIRKQKQRGEQQAGKERPFARSSGMVRGVHRQSRGHRSACARTRFSGLRFEMPYEKWLWKVRKHSVEQLSSVT